METIISERDERRLPGRPREFDPGVALDKAITVFTRNGYSATSIADLTAALGLTSGSLYKAFGDKQGLFCAALERYVGRRAQQLDARLAQARNGREKVEALLRVYAEQSCGEAGRTGCLVVASVVEFASSHPELRGRVTRLLASHESRLLHLIREGQADGSITPGLDPQATAQLLLCVLQGMRVIGKTGRSRVDMATVAETAMRLLG